MRAEGAHHRGNKRDLGTRLHSAALGYFRLVMIIGLLIALPIAAYALTDNLFFDGILNPGNTASSGWSYRYGHKICNNSIGDSIIWSSTPYPPDPMQYPVSKSGPGCAGFADSSSHYWKTTCRNQGDYQIDVECYYITA